MKPLVVLASILFPGFGPALASRPHRMALWLALWLGTAFSATWSVWFVPLGFAALLASAVDGVRCVRGSSGPGRARRPLAALAIVIGLLGAGFAKVAFQALIIPSASMYPTLVIGDHIYIEKLTLRWHPIERGEVIVHRYPCDRDLLMVKRIVGIAGDTIEIRCNVLYVNGTAVANQLIDGSCSYLDEKPDGSRYPQACSRYRETLDGRSYDVFHDRDRPERDRAADPHGDAHDFPVLDRPFPPSCNQTAGPLRGRQVAQPIGRFVQTKVDVAACEPQLHYVVPRDSLFGLGDHRDSSNDSRAWGAIPADEVVGRAVGVWLSTGEEGGWGRFGAIR